MGLDRKNHRQFIAWVGIAILIATLSSCLTWYERRQEYNAALERKDWSTASKSLEKSVSKRNRNRVLNLLELGFVHRQLGDLTISNRYFLEADQMMEDFRKGSGSEMLALVSNPMMKPYQVEDVEFVLVHYYLALNFLELREFESAQVECRRIQLRLNELADKYKGKNRYSCDAFVMMLSGAIYEALGNFNDAFIAYRNAYECYQTVAQLQFGTAVPNSLKQDILRTARKNGFYDEMHRYEKDWGIVWAPDSFEGAEVVVLVNNGLGPVKAESSLNFFMVQGAGGMVNFTDETGGFNFPFMMPSSTQEQSALGRVQSLRVAFPKYTERDRRWSSIEVQIEGNLYPMEVVENVNAIALKSLEDRMLREMGNSLLRLAVKKGIEAAIREQDQTLGAIAGLAGSIAERADTRNWQSLPYEVLMVRIPLAPGEHTLLLKYPGSAISSDSIKVKLRAGETTFISRTVWK